EQERVGAVHADRALARVVLAHDRGRAEQRLAHGGRQLIERLLDHAVELAVAHPERRAVALGVELRRAAQRLLGRAALAEPLERGAEHEQRLGVGVGAARGLLEQPARLLELAGLEPLEAGLEPLPAHSPSYFASRRRSERRLIPSRSAARVRL